MNVFLLILAGILLLIVLLLFCPFVIKLRFDEKLSLKVGYLFPIISIPIGEETDPVKRQKKEEKKRKKEEKKQRKAEKKQQKKGKAENAPEEEKKENFVLRRIKSEGLSGLIELMQELVRILGYFVGKITDHLVISQMDLRLDIATEDAAKTAMTCGYASSVLFPMIAFIEQHVKRCNHREQIIPVFTQTETKVRFLLKARIMPFFILSAAVGSLIKTLRVLKPMMRDDKQEQKTPPEKSSEPT